jgi:hypothetical protein
LRVIELENALCNQDKLLCKIFCENKKLNLEFESASSEIATLRSTHDDMSAKLYDNCKMIMVNYVDLWLVHSHVASLLDGARLELRELKAHSTLLGACTTYPLLRSDLEAVVVEIKNLKYKLNHSSRYTILSPPCEASVSLKGKLFHATKENIDLQQEVAYLTLRLEKIILSEKMIEEDLSRVEESAMKSTYRLGIGFQRCEKKNEKNAPKFVPSSSYHKEEEALKPTKTHYPSNPKSSINPKRGVKRESPKPREKAFVYIFCGRDGHLDEFWFQRKRLERKHFEYARNSYCDEFFDFRLVLTLMLCLALLHVLFLSSLIDLTITHMVLVHKRTALSLDVLVMTHVHVVVIVSRIGLVFLLEGPTPTLSQDTWMVHAFPIMVHIPLGQVVRCKGL